MTFDITPFRSLYPFESHWLDLDGLCYHYVDEGEGDPIVCVHGNPSWSFLYRDVIKSLRDSHRVIAVDHIGCGLSDKPADDKYSYTLYQRIEDLERLLDKLNLKENITLILHDWGGMIGMGMALRQPERIKRIVLLNTAAFMLPKGRRLPVRLKLIRHCRLLANILVRGFNAFSFGATLMASKKGLNREVSAAFRAPYNNWANRIATLRFVQDIPLNSRHTSYATAKWVEDHLHILKNVPKLICWGEKDFVFDRYFLAEWKNRFPEAQVHTFPEAGHYCLEDAGEEIIPLVKTFLEKYPLDKPSDMTGEKQS